ncbi:MAG: hypothetical protein M1838_001617 [Thelocarpon superellum]|nr:MAG: hypothetical protein M1838_001617 [Thelocarpon superellum]
MVGPPWFDRLHVDGFLEQPDHHDGIMLLIQTILTCGALAWLLHRAWQTFTKPLPELVHLLGLDVPAAPAVSLTGIDADSITLHWTRPAEQSPAVKYFIQVNGVNVGELSYLDTAITVSGLKANNFYSVRVIATNTNGFHAGSRVIRLKTLAGPPPLNQSVRPRIAVGDHAQIDGRMEAATPTSVQLSSTTPTTVTAQEVPVAATKRLPNTRKVSPPAPPVEAPGADGPSSDESSEGEQSVRYLTDALDTLRREADEIQNQISREDEEFTATKATVSRERDQLKHALKEREEMSAELRKEVANRDRQNRSVQSRRTAEEKILQQKLDERMKLEQDMRKWDQQMADMARDLTEWAERKGGVVQATEQRLNELQQQMGASQKQVRALEEQIKTRGVQIKALEEERRHQQGEDNKGDSRLAGKGEDDEEGRWEHRLRELQSNYAKAMHSLQQAQGNHRQAQERLSWWTKRGIYHSTDFARHVPIDPDIAGSKKVKARRSRPRRSRTNTVSSGNGFNAGDPRVPGYGDPTPGLPSATPGTPFFNMGNGMAVPATPEDSTAIAQADVERLTGNAEISPTANALLPANLLGDEDGPTPEAAASSGMHVVPAFGGAFPSLGPSTFDPFQHEHHSPASSGSRSASVFSSPRESLNNVSMFPSAPDSLMEPDRRSIHSTSASLGAVGTGPDGTTSSSRRFASLFSLNLSRQRGKTLDVDPPMLGTLKANETQSFPAALDHPSEELDPIGTKRRRGIHSTSWVSPMTNFNFLGRHPTSAGSTSAGQAPATMRATAGRRKPFNMFSSKYDPLDPSRLLGEPTTPPRPSSLSLSEHAFPRPSTDTPPFGWPAVDAFGHRSSPLGADWAIRSDEPWSRGPSRRSSIKHGSTPSLPLGTTPFQPDDFHDVLAQRLLPAPIGTRAETTLGSGAPKLNPAAPTFKTIFTRSDAKRAERAERAERAAERAAEREKEKDLEWLRDDSATDEGQARMSHDDHSVKTEDSQADSHNSFDQLPFGTPLESNTPNAKDRDKQSIFQKLTRKGSSSKFNIPWKDKGSRFSSSSKRSTDLEHDEGGGFENGHPFGKSVDSVNLTASPHLAGVGASTSTNTTPTNHTGTMNTTAHGNTLSRSSISWSSLMRKPKKGGAASIGSAGGSHHGGGGEKSSVSEASERTNSEGGDYDDGRSSVGGSCD